MLLLHSYADLSDISCCFEQIAAAAKIPDLRLIGFRLISLNLWIEVALDPADDGLGGGEISRCQEHENPIRSRLENIHLAVAGYVVHASIRA